LTEKIEKTYRENYRSIKRFIERRISSAEDSEDLLQDIFMKALDDANSLYAVENLAAWFFRAAANRVIDWYRRKKRREVSMPGGAEEATVEDLIGDSGIDIEKDFIRSLVVESLINSIEELPPEQAWVIIGQGIEGRTFKELSQESGIPINTLISRKRYALSFLQNRLTEIKGLLSEV